MRAEVNAWRPCLQLHQHRRLTRAQSHHCSDEERKRRKILARKVGGAVVGGGVDQQLKGWTESQQEGTCPCPCPRPVLKGFNQHVPPSVLAPPRLSCVDRIFVSVQKSRRSACETEEDASIRNNNSGALLLLLCLLLKWRKLGVYLRSDRFTELCQLTFFCLLLGSGASSPPTCPSSPTHPSTTGIHSPSAHEPLAWLLSWERLQLSR